MADTLSMLSIISFIIAGVALATAAFLWIFFKIPWVIGDLSGRNARKSVAKMRARNEKTGGRSYRPSAANAARGKLTSTIPQIHAEQITEEIKPDGDMPETGLLAENRARKKETTGTEVLVEKELTKNLSGEKATVPLTDCSVAGKQHAAQGKQLQMIEEVILIHTDEMIE